MNNRYLAPFPASALALAILSSSANAQSSCTAGTYDPPPLDGACVDADPGYYVAADGATSQTAASRGFFVDSSGATAELEAPPGYYVSGTAATEATQANIGYFAAGPAATDQTIAPVGTFVDSVGASTATLAPVGRFVGSPGQSFAEIAAPGYFVANPGQSAPTPAQPGFFVDTAGATAQIPCPAGTTSLAPAATACITVEVGDGAGSGGDGGSGDGVGGSEGDPVDESDDSAGPETGSEIDEQVEPEAEKEGFHAQVAKTNGTASDAKIRLVARNGVSSSHSSTLAADQNIALTAYISPDPRDLGLAADFYIVVGITGSIAGETEKLFYLSPEGFKPFPNVDLNALESVQKTDALGSEEIAVDIYSGPGEPAKLRLYAAYRAEGDAELTYTTEPLEVDLIN